MNQTDEEIIEKFKQLKTRKDVADLLEIKDKSLRYFLFAVRPENMYTQFEIMKKSGGIRIICAPNKQLKEIQKNLAYILSLIYKPKICAYGFIKGKSILENAQNHVRRNYIFNIDLKDFFHQIHFGRIQGMLKSKPYLIGDEAAITIAQIACYNGYLPQGAPSSPILTNMICVSLDNQLIQYAKKNNIIYTRYADDLSFSTYNEVFDKEIVSLENNQLKLGSKVRKLIGDQGFEINVQKLNLKDRTQRQEVTGIIVNKFPNIKREYIKNLRAILHNCKIKGTYATAIDFINKGFCHNPKIIEAIHDPQKEEYICKWFKQVITGKINYIKQVKGEDSMTFLSFAQKANELFEQSLFDISALDELNKIIEDNLYILEDFDIDYRQGTGFYIKDIGLFTGYHLTEKGGIYKVYTNESYSKAQKIGVISKEINEISSDKGIDYAVYKFKSEVTSSINFGDSTKLKTGTNVIVAGYPDMKKGDTVTIQSCNIIGQTSLYGATFYKVSGRIVHGASGGAVFNTKNELIGIIKGGIASLEEDDKNDLQGFVPIDLVINDLKNKSILS